MRITKKALSIILAIAMLITAVPMSLTGFAADISIGSEDTPVNTAQSDTLIRPAATITATPVTRICADPSNPMKGTTGSGTIVAATPSGIPMTSYAYAAAAYAGETPTYTTITFTPGREVTDVALTCSHEITTGEYTINNGVHTVTVTGGTANVGDTIIFTVSYKYVYTDSETGKTYNSDKTFESVCYSHVESVLEPAGIYSYERTNNGWGATQNRSYISTFILGEATYSESTSAGSVNFNGAGTTTSYGKMFIDASNDDNSRRWNVSYAADGNRPITHVYMDKGANSTLADLNLRAQAYSANNSDESDEITENSIRNIYEYSGNVQTYGNKTSESPNGNTASSALSLQKASGSFKMAGTYLTMGFTGAGPAQASATADTTAEYTVIIDMQTAAQWSDVSVTHSHTIKVTVFNKANLLATIQRTQNSEAANKLITTGNVDGKGYNPQEWYYSSGWQAFEGAYNTAMATYVKPNATQSDIDLAAANLESAYNGLILNEANYTELDYEVSRANALDSSLYTPASWARVETALAKYEDNINILYQPVVDQIALDIRNAINALEYADADYTKVEEQVAVANALIYDVPAEHNGLTVEQYYSNWNVVKSAIEGCGYTYDADEGAFILTTILTKDKQSTVDQYPTTISAAIAKLTPNKADFTAATAAMNGYTSFRTANASYLDGTYLASLDTAYSKLYELYNQSVTIDKQGEVDTATATLNNLLNNPVYAPANYNAADRAIARADELERDIYKDLTAVDEAYTALKALYNLDKRSQTQIDNAVAALNTAIDNLEMFTADYTLVEQAIAAVEQKKAETLASKGIAASVYYSNWSAVETAVNNVVYGLPFDQQATINAYASAINAALGALKVATADYSALTALEAQADIIIENEAMYTPESFENLVNAYFAITSHTLTIDKQSTVNAWADDLSAAIDAMEYVAADYSAVTAAVKAANAKIAESQAFADSHNGVQYYSAETLAAVQDAINAVDYTLKADKQATVNGYATTINNKVALLAYGPADYTAVEAAKARIPADLTCYTSASVANLNSALAYNTAYTTNRQSKVDEIAAAINDAIDKLVVKGLDYTSYDAAEAKLAAKDMYGVGVYTKESENAVVAAQDAIAAWVAAETRDYNDQAEFEALVAVWDAKIDALEFKPIDTSTYEAVKQTVPADTSCYTDASVQNVTDAKTAIDNFLAGDVNITHQIQLNELVEAFIEAITNLEYKPIDTTEYESVKATIPSSTVLYTDASVQNVTNAKAAVESFLAGDVDIRDQEQLNALVATLRTAIGNLAYKPINTAQYESVKATIPADTSVYTDTTVNAVTEAKAAVETFLAGNVDIRNQTQLNNLVTALSEAIGKLDYKPIDTTGYEAVDATVPADLTVYTDASVQEMNDAKAAVEAFLAGDLDIRDQAQLDALVNTYDAKIKALAIKVTAYFQANANSTCVIDGDYIYGLQTRLTKNALTGTYLDFEGVEVVVNAATTGRFIGTGSTVVVTYPDGTVETYTIIIYGDMDANGSVDNSDISGVKSYLSTGSAITAAQKKAMNLDLDRRNTVTITDLSILKSVLSSGSTINQVDPTA